LYSNIPDWAGDLISNSKIEKLKHYQDWLFNEGVKKGLISNKSKQYIWEEFILHSIGFSYLMNTKNKPKYIADLGTGAGIPGIPIAIASPEKEVFLVDTSRKRIGELKKIKVLLDLNNIYPTLMSAHEFISQNQNKIGAYVSRCFKPREEMLDSLFVEKTLSGRLLLVSSGEGNLEEDNKLFHVKREKIKLNKGKIRHIDVITFK
tara:strand:- start:791 stop:1405 length:615 start_codon:yes stop_codon:yes gene_type:complete